MHKGDDDRLLSKRYPYQLQPHQIDLLKPVQQLPRDDGAAFAFKGTLNISGDYKSVVTVGESAFSSAGTAESKPPRLT